MDGKVRTGGRGSNETVKDYDVDRLLRHSVSTVPIRTSHIFDRSLLVVYFSITARQSAQSKTLQQSLEVEALVTQLIYSRRSCMSLVI